MQKSTGMQMAQTAHRRVQTSTTLNRKYVQRPTKSSDIMRKDNNITPKNMNTIIKNNGTAIKAGRNTANNNVAINIKRSPKIQRYNSSFGAKVTTKPVEKIAPVVAHPLQTTARTQMQLRQQRMQAPQMSKMSAKELKDQAIKKALASANSAPTMAEKINKASDNPKKIGKLHFSVGRVALALSCAAVVVFAIAYFVNLNMPDISLRVAAMQTGIEASYPSYVPRDYKLSGITSEEGKIGLNFSSNNSENTFTLEEEKSSWDSNALLSNFVKVAYGENYTIVREQGLTIYISGSNAAWANGGIVYKISAANDTLTNKQIRAIATSL